MYYLGYVSPAPDLNIEKKQGMSITPRTDSTVAVHHLIAAACPSQAR
jgi:hypothetical protein